MAVTNYLTVDDQIIAESTSGVRTDYMSDALGSTTGTVDQSAVILNAYRYKPYGAVLSKSGAGSDPIFQWVGSAGYNFTSLAAVDFYVRHRFYGSAQAAWSTVDPTWPSQPAYRYSTSSPTVVIDRNGMAPLIIAGNGCTECQNMCGYSTIVADINAGMERFCLGYWGTGKEGSKKQCIDDCAEKWKNKNGWIEDCLNFVCNNFGNLFRCLTEEEVGGNSCIPDDPFDCPKGCNDEEVLYPELGNTNCTTGIITLCCFDINVNCCCPPDGGLTEQECKERRWGDRVMAIVLHEIFHYCSTDCAPDPPGGSRPSDKDCFALCVSKCYDPPLFEDPWPDKPNKCFRL